MDIKPIDTVYNGYKFRSRLEARWAVFFDELGIEYEYEPEGFELSDGTRYLPDFYLPKFNYYVEVKGRNEHIHDDVYKMEQFVEESKTSVLVLSEVPYDENSKGLYLFRTIWFTSKYVEPVERGGCFFWVRDGVEINDYYYICRRIWAVNGYITNEHAYQHLQALYADEFDDGECRLRDWFDFKEYFKPIEDALLKARQARFEYGETPKADDNGKSDYMVCASNNEIIERASKSKCSEDFKKLYSGEWRYKYKNRNEADRSLCQMIWYFSGNVEQTIEMFKRSGLGKKGYKSADYLKGILEDVSHHNKTINHWTKELTDTPKKPKWRVI